jgi:superfamily II DNA or RNA helicase
MFIVPIASNVSSRLAISDGLIRALFKPAVVEAGRAYELRGRVLEMEIAGDGSSIVARTQGSASDPYAQRIAIGRQRSGDIAIVGHCSCPVGRNCKHVVAVLYAARRQLRSSERAARQQPPARPPAKPAGRRKAGQNGGTLPHNIAGWLDDLQEAQQSETGADAPGTRNRLIYVVGIDDEDCGMPHARIHALTVPVQKNGKFGPGRPCSARQAQTANAQLRPDDKIILGRLAQRKGDQTEDDPTDTLRRVVSSGRAFWAAPDGRSLAPGPDEPGQIAWKLEPDGSQHAQVVVRQGLFPLLTPDAWYINLENGEIGAIALDLPAPVVRRLLSAPPIPADHAQEVRAALARRLPALGLPIPEELPQPQKIPGPPVPHLRLMNGTLPMDPMRGRGIAKPVGGGLFGVPLVRLSFGYGPLSLAWSPQPPARIVGHNGTLYQPERNLRLENAALDRLEEFGFDRVSGLVPVHYRHAHSDDFALTQGDSDTDWLSFVTRDVAELRAKGWTVEIDDDFALQVVTPYSGFDAELLDGSGIDWLELKLGVQIDGQHIDLVPALVQLLGRSDTEKLLTLPDNAPLTLPLADGRLIALPLDRFRPMLQALLELYSGGRIDPNASKIGFTRLDAAELARFEEISGATWKGGESLRSLGRLLREGGGAIPHIDVPQTFKGSLRPYQSQGVDWLQFLRSAELGGILADDMGLGKTVQTLAHLLSEQAAGRLDRPALIVCPTSLIPNWTLEAARFAPGLKLLSLHGSSRKERFPEIQDHDLVLTTYPLLARDHTVLTAQEWHVVILDEAQTIKNPNAETTRQALRLKARQRLCLSGTPLQNHLGELWSLFDFLAPGFLGSQRAFRSRYRVPIEKHGNAAIQEQLNRRIRPFLLRRTKDEVVKELPPKTEISEPVELEAGQRTVYESVRLAMHDRVREAIAAKGVARSGIVILDALLKMRQACCDPRLLKLKATERAKAGSAKLDRLMEMLTVMLAEGRRVLLFSQFTEMLALIEQRLREDEIAYVLLTGDTKDRATPVKRFQAGEVPVFLISLKAGGVGLNLTAADTVIHYDPWWNPAAEDQATDRAHRIGQTRKVFVHRLVTLGTIEEKMEALKEKKRALVASVLQAETGGALKLTEADIDALFSPAA